MSNIAYNSKVILQEKGGMFYAVISYKDLTGNWKKKWKKTEIAVKPGNKRQAQDKAQEIKMQFDSEMDFKIEPKENKNEDQLNLEFVDFMNLRLEEVRIARLYEYDTYAGYKTNINTHMKGFFGTSSNEDSKKKKIYKVKDITSELIDKYFKYLSVEKGLKNNTIIHHRKQISVAFEILDRKGIAINPTRNTQALKSEVYKCETYSMQEIQKLIEVIKNDVIEIPILLGIYYGLRRSEVVGLKWSAINFEEDYIYINHTIIEVIGKEGIVESKMVAKDRTKSIHSNRKLPLYKEVKEILLEKQKRIELNKQIFREGYCEEHSEYVCVKDDGTMIKPSHISHRFLKILRKNEMKEIRFHDLRHTLGTELNANGMDLKSIGEFLGHGNLSTTKRYSHPDDRVKLNVASQYEKMIEEAKRCS